MISERQQIASRFRSEGEGEAAKILGDRQRDLSVIESEAYEKVQEIRGEADATRRARPCLGRVRTRAVTASAAATNSRANSEAWDTTLPPPGAARMTSGP